MTAVKTENNEARHRFEAYVDGELAGYAVYRLHGGDVIEFVHTEVDDVFEGLGVGSTLARDALDDVRRDGTRRVVATCPFIRDWIERHPEYRSLLA